MKLLGGPAVYLLALMLVLVQDHCHPEITEQSVVTRQFGTVEIYLGTSDAKGVTLLLSGEDGWNEDLAEVAKAVAELGYLVGVIDIRGYLLGPGESSVPCRNPAVDLADLGDTLQQRFRLSPNTRKPPLLVGYAAGGSLVYATLLLAKGGVFHAGISLGFCPEFPGEERICGALRSEVTVSPKRPDSMLVPTRTLETPWFVFQVGDKQACSAEMTAEFIGRIDNAKLISQDESIPGVPAERAWLSKLTALMQWLDPDITGQVLNDADVTGVPLTEVRADGSRDKRLALMLSGDGGWAQLDRSIAATLGKHGIDTVGWDSLSYFWKAKTPEEAATDLGRVLNHYLTSWRKNRVLLIGYSFGADVLPFMVSRLPGPLRERIDLLVFLGLATSASFEFHLVNWIGVERKDALAVLPEVSRLTGMSLLCVYGDREVNSACPALRGSDARVVALPGDHHFGGAYETIVDRILEASTESPRRQP